MDGCEVPGEQDAATKENVTVKNRSLFSLAKFVFFGRSIKKSFNSSSLAPAQEVHLGRECAIGK
ncbi:hypothetical protein QT996_00855 [Microcoleus sp. S13C4]